MISWEPRKTYGHIATIPTPSYQELPESKSAGEVLANAQLVSAAPELLAALKNLLGYATGEWQPEDEASLAGHGIEPAWGAIAKAEGTPS